MKRTELLTELKRIERALFADRTDFGKLPNLFASKAAHRFAMRRQDIGRLIAALEADVPAQPKRQQWVAPKGEKASA